MNQKIELNEEELAAVKEIERISKKAKSKRKIELVSFLLMLISLIIMLGNLLGDDKISKSDIHSDIITAVNNNADLNVVKNIYKNRKKLNKNIANLIFKDNENYIYTVSLADILIDLRSSIYLSKQPDLEFIKKIDVIISDYSKTNPFDSLESNQKDLFLNIQQKLSNNFTLVERDINKLANELERKNQLVNKYLKDSTTSFWISIIAFGFSFILGIIQIIFSFSKVGSINKNKLTNA